MELVVNNSKFGSIATLIAHYGGVVASNIVKVVNGKDVSLAGVKEPKAILSTLVEKSEFSKVLSGASLDHSSFVDEYVSLAASNNFDIVNANIVSDLDNKLKVQSFAVAHHITAADLVLYPSLFSWVSKASIEDRVKACNVTRYFNHIQHLPGVIGVVSDLPLIPIDQDLPAPAPKKKEAAVEVAAPQPTKEKAPAKEETPLATENVPKKEKPVKAPKAPAAPVEKRALDDVTRLNIRVGTIVKAWPHPEADKLWCEEIDIGEATGPRQIASGLRDYMTHEQMEGARVLVVANLRPRTMRGFTSNGMVMCASSEDRSKIEFIVPPADAPNGTLITWPGYDGEPEELLPKKDDVFGAVAPGFATDLSCVATFKGVAFTTPYGICKSSTIANAPIS